ncbi:MAG: substrate-binding domain-containing protein [Lachnospiraceae bacterium]|nr:substrate-binding domain-containing protein [Lachnospiraceae bacterium]
MKKKIVAILMTMTMCAAALAGCGNKEADDTNYGKDAGWQTGETSDFDAAMGISVISREDGSGTRGAFIELFGVEQKNEAGKKVDYTTVEATITNNTSVMMTTVAGDEYSIGYISLGSLNNTVKALKIDGVEASVENIKNDTYKVARPFNIATKGDMNDAAKDFVNYIMSAEGQAIIADNGYITIDDAAPAFAGGQAEGKVVVAGSSSVSPVMEKLAEGYQALNGKVKIELQTSDSTTGMTSAIDGTCDIGMASRALKEAEEAELTATTIAMDGIAVIVNKANPAEDLAADQVRAIFMGETLSWDEVQ